MFEAARVGDDIGHSQALMGMIGGTLVGGLVAAAGGIAAGALMLAGIGASCLGIGVLLAGASIAVGYLTGELATVSRDSLADAGAASMMKMGALTTGSHNVFINGRPAAIATGSMAICSVDGPQQMAEGSSRVYINDLPAARTGDRATCGAQVIVGSGNVLIGGDVAQALPVQPAVPEWLYKASDLTLLFAGLTGGIVAAGKTGALGRLLSKLPGINQLARIACRAGALMTSAAAVGIIARPIDIVSGQKFLSGDDELDFILPSRLPVRWQRYWRSGNPGDSVLGRGWNLFWETRLARYQDGLIWRAPSGDYLSFPLVPRGKRSYCEAEKYWLEHHQDDSWSVYDISDERWHYGPLNSDEPSLPLRLAEPCGNDILFEWNPDRSLHALIDSAGQRIVCRYAHNRLTGAWLDDDICLVSYAYDEAGQLLTVTGRGGSVRRRFQWHDGLMNAHEDANRLKSEYRWQEISGLPRVVAFRHNGGEQLNIIYDFANGTRCVMRDDGEQAHWLIDDDNNVARFTDYDGRETAFVWHHGELCDVILPGGAMRRSRWDKYGRMTEETDPAGRRTRYHWFRLTDRIVRTEYPDGTATQNRYDLSGRLLAETDALGNTLFCHYPDDEETLPDSITDAAGGVVQLAWSRQGQLTARTDCSGSVTRFDYDRFGQLIGTTDAEGNVTRREWNAAGQLCVIIHPDNSRESLLWNECGQLSVWRDALESEVRWHYNVLGLPVSLTDRIGRTCCWHYDPRGNLLRLENGNGGEYGFTYDAAGRPVSETRPDGTVRFMEWDARGLLSVLQENSQPTADGGISRRWQQFSYDESGLLLERRTRDATFRCERDANGQPLRLRRTPTDEGAARGIEADEVAFAYDGAGRLRHESGVNGALDYHRDVLGNLCGLLLPGGQQLAWLRYGSGHVSAIRFNQQPVTEFTRDRLHREIHRIQGGREQQRTYDSLGRRVVQRSMLSADIALPEQEILERTFRYSARGELAGVSDTLRGDVNYGYDAEGRLRKHYEARQGYSTARFSYDAADNLTGQSAPPVPDNRLRQWQNLFMQYDGWGNLVRRRSGLYEQRYRYDAENRLIAAEGTGPQGKFSARYHYDALGRRSRKTITTARGTSETRFLWQGYRLLQEQQEKGRCHTYVYDPADIWSPLARIDHAPNESQGDIQWFTTDLNGAPLEVTDERGALRWSGQYGSFGEVRRQTEGFLRLAHCTSLHHQPLRYAGQYADAETGLHYNLFRYYDPQVGRFTVQDPLGLAGGLNLYQYAVNPLSWIDPLGLRKCSSTRKPEKVKSKSTGRTRPRNKNEEYALDHVMKHPENGMAIIKADQIGDPHFKGKGWTKVEQKINNVIIHYMAKFDKNGKMSHVTDYKIKD